jgi:hypothetical protein
MAIPLNLDELKCPICNCLLQYNEKNIKCNCGFIDVETYNPYQVRQEIIEKICRFKISNEINDNRGDDRKQEI